MVTSALPSWDTLLDAARLLGRGRLLGARAEGPAPDGARRVGVPRLGLPRRLLDHREPRRGRLRAAGRAVRGAARRLPAYCQLYRRPTRCVDAPLTTATSSWCSSAPSAGASATRRRSCGPAATSRWARASCRCRRITAAAERRATTAYSRGAVRYMPRICARGGGSGAHGSLHATIALATADWSWASLVEAAGAAGWGAAAGAPSAELEALPTTLDQQRTGGGARRRPRRPPAPARLLRRFAASTPAAASARWSAPSPSLRRRSSSRATRGSGRPAQRVELVRAYAAKADAHNAQQDAARPPAAGAELHVRRLREGEEAAPRRARGLLREELSPDAARSACGDHDGARPRERARQRPALRRLWQALLRAGVRRPGALLFCDAGGEAAPLDRTLT